MFDTLLLIYNNSNSNFQSTCWNWFWAWIQLGGFGVRVAVCHMLSSPINWAYYVFSLIKLNSFLTTNTAEVTKQVVPHEEGGVVRCTQYPRGAKRPQRRTKLTLPPQAEAPGWGGPQIMVIKNIWINRLYIIYNKLIPTTKLVPQQCAGTQSVFFFWAF